MHIAGPSCEGLDQLGNLRSMNSSEFTRFSVHISDGTSRDHRKIQFTGEELENCGCYRAEDIRTDSSITK